MSTVTKAAEIPPEIWCHICQYIAPSDRPNFALVRRSFYGITVSDLYRHVEVVSRDPTRFWYAFQTLDREKDLAKRLTKLTIWVHALNEVIHLEDTIKLYPGHSKRQASEGRVKNSIRHLLARRKSDAIAVAEPSSSPIDKHALFMGVLSKLENLRDLVLVWQPDDGYTKTSPTTCSQLAIDTWARVSPNIRSLTLDMAMFNLYETLRVPQELKVLEELHIRITLERHGAFRGNATRILTNTLIPFINNLAPQLTALSFTSLCNLNLDPLFQWMEPTPLLRRLTLCLAFQSHERWSPGALQTFLRDRSHIKQLDLRYAKCCAALFQHNWTTHDRALVGQAFGGPDAFTFPHLESLTLGLQFRLSHEFLLAHYVSRFSGSVSSLTLLGRSLPFTQIKLVLAPFQKTLRCLTMFVKVLTLEMLREIATYLPSLRELTLHVQSFSTKQNFIEEIRAGIRQHDHELLRQWGLWRIHIREFAYAKGDVPAWDVMRVLGEAIPSVTSWDP